MYLTLYICVAEGMGILFPITTLFHTDITAFILQVISKTSEKLNGVTFPQVSRISSAFIQTLYASTGKNNKSPSGLRLYLSIPNNTLPDWHPGCLAFLVFLKQRNSTEIHPYNLCGVLMVMSHAAVICLSLYKQIKFHTVVKRYFSLHLSNRRYSKLLTS